MKYKINMNKSNVSGQEEKIVGTKDQSETKALNSRVFLASSHCKGANDNYLFAFGGDLN